MNPDENDPSNVLAILKNAGFEECEFEAGECSVCGAQTAHWWLPGPYDCPNDGEHYCEACALKKVRKDDAELKAFNEWYEKNRCPECGVPDDAKVCPNCGHVKGDTIINGIQKDSTLKRAFFIVALGLLFDGIGIWALVVLSTHISDLESMLLLIAGAMPLSLAFGMLMGYFFPRKSQNQSLITED